MKLALLHLSDAHFRADGNNPVLRREDAIGMVVAGVQSILLSSELDAFFVVFTGDIAAAGREPEYRGVAAKFLSELCQRLAPLCPDSQVPQVIAVPGNHDCCFDGYDPKDTREVLLTKSGEDLSEDSLKICLHVQRHFRSFEEGLVDDAAFDVVHQRSCTEVRDYRTQAGVVRFVLLNTAWCSREKEQETRLSFPLQELPLPSALPDADLAISIQHHPANWLGHVGSRAFVHRVEQLVDASLTGHEHASSDRREERAHGATVSYFEGLAFQDNSGASAFKVIVLDTEERRSVGYTLTYSGGHYLPEERGPRTMQFLRNSARTSTLYQLSDRFRSWLLDAELPFSGIEVGKLDLPDIFVYPDVRQGQRLSHRKQEYQRVTADRVLLVEPCQVFQGTEYSGKTTLAKMTFQLALDRQYVPVLVRGSALTFPKRAAFQDVVDKAFKECYSTPGVEGFRQLPPERRVLVIDDLHRSKLSASKLNLFLAWARLSFGHVVAFASEVLTLEELSPDADTSEIMDTPHYDILPFGHERRDELIHKWYVRTHPDADSEARAEMASRCKRAMDLVIDNKFVPHVPLYVMGILHQIEAKQNLEKFTATQGAVYDAIATLSLTREVGGDLPLYRNYLANLAFEMYSRQTRCLTKADYRQWHSAFCSRHLIEKELSEMRESLIKAQLLYVDADSEEVMFRHRYGYYLFLAEYLARHLGEASIKERVAAMSRKLHHQENSSILVFLCNRATAEQATFIIETMMQAAQDQFRAHAEARLEDDVAALAEASSKNVPLELPAGRVEERRRDHFRAVDELDGDDPYGNPREDDLTERDLEAEADSEIRRYIYEMDAALKTVHILGQILRQFYGVLEGQQKLEIASGAYSLAMRVLGFYVGFVVENHPQIVQGLATHMLRSNPSLSADPDRVRAGAEFFLADLCEKVAWALIRRCADATGLQALEPVFERVLTGSGGGGERPPMSYRLIDAALRLHYFSKIPYAALKEARKQALKNQFASRVLQYLVLDYMHVNYVSAQTKQSLANTVGIKALPKSALDTVTKRLGHDRST